MKKKKVFIIIITLTLTVVYYLIGFPLTILGVVKEWPLFPGGVTLKYEGNNNSGYADEAVLPDNDGPYIFFKGDSIKVVQILVKDSVSVPTFQSVHKRDKELVSVDCQFINNPEWNFSAHLKDTLVNEATRYTGVPQTLVISDIEGNFGAFRELLIANGVIDSAYHWIFSKGHLVLVGDFFDRGLNVTECLWLIYHLENEAKKSGGYVHFMLGNHEIMNMTDDFRYVRKKYVVNGDLIGTPYSEFYKTNSALGRWLATKNVVEKINETIFVHGGISEAVLDMKISLDDINRLSRPYYFTSRKELPEQDQSLKPLFDSHDAPFWHRDYVNQESDEKFIDEVLSTFNAKEIVVGHTIVDHVTTFYSNKVIAVDTRHTEPASYALLITDGIYFSVDRRGHRNRIK